MTAKIVYTSAARPHFQIDIHREYTFGREDKGYFVALSGGKRYLPLSYFKTMFTPVGMTWDELMAQINPPAPQPSQARPRRPRKPKFEVKDSEK